MERGGFAATQTPCTLSRRVSRSPTEVYIAWFDELAPELARELAVVLRGLFPGGLLEPAVISDDPLDGFVQRIRRMANTPTRDAGVALCLAGLTDLAVFERASEEGAAQTGVLMDVLGEVQSVLAKAGEDLAHDVENWIEEQQLRQPLRTRQWQRVQSTWKPLREGPLSIASVLETWRILQLGLARRD